MTPAVAPRPAAGLRAVAWEAPVAPLESLWAVSPAEPAVLWDAREDLGGGLRLAGLGVAAAVDAAPGEEARAATALLASVRPAADGAPLRLVGGRGFEGEATATGPWARFGASRWILPRWTYLRERERARLVYVGPADGVDGTALRRERAAIERALLHGAPLAPPPSRLVEEELSRERWRHLVEAARAAVSDGRCEKVVVARRSRFVVTEGAHDARRVLAALADATAGCIRFGVRAVGGAAFLGATPERLVARRGLVVASEALAGTAASSSDPALLLASAKDAVEHAPVVRAIRDALEPLCATLDVAPAPTPLRLRDVWHLRTAIRGRLDGPRHVLDLAHALHPTPAVAGAPRETALAILRALEAPRGRYAAPVGWCDAEGQGDVAVALRSALLDGSEAFAWAGCGIVAASDVDAEWAETAAKLRRMRAALGAGEAT